MRREFATKQKITMDRLGELGITFPKTALSTFYAWGDISKLPAEINGGEKFMRRAFQHQVLTVPGEFFDVNPHRSRTQRSPLTNYVRFSFGPPRANLEAGLGRLAEMVKGVKL